MKRNRKKQKLESIPKNSQVFLEKYFPNFNKLLKSHFMKYTIDYENYLNLN